MAKRIALLRRLIRWAGGRIPTPVPTPTPDVTAPNPSPMTWVTEPVALDSSSIYMVGTTPLDFGSTSTEGPYLYFECETNSAYDSGWITSTTYIAKGLDPATMYTFNVKAKDAAGNTTVKSVSRDATTEAAPDTDAPTPNPPTWDSVPAALDSSSIEMTATVGADATGPVEYNFELVSGSGGHSSGWQASETYTDTGLTPNTAYSYRLRMRDALGNRTGYSSTESATTAQASDITPPTPNPSHQGEHFARPSRR